MNLQELIKHDRPLYTGGSAAYPYSSALEQKYKFTTRFGDECMLHRLEKSRGLIHLPRALCPVGVSDRRKDGIPVVFPKGPTPRPYQEDIYKQIEEMCLGNHNGLIVAGTGTGKTSMGCHGAYVKQVQTLVVVTKDDIFKEWHTAAQEFLGLDPKKDIGIIRGDKCQVTGKKFVIAMIQSLCKPGRYPVTLLAGFGLVIFDECHRLPADKFSYVADLIPAKMRMGLSATPDRPDGKELLLYAHLGPMRAKLEGELLIPKILRIKSEWVCPRVFKTDPHTQERKVVRIEHQPGKTMHIDKIMAADPVRNALLCDIIRDVHSKPGRFLMVFSTLHDHLKALYRACREHYAIPVKDMGWYIGTTNKEEAAKRDKELGRRILFTTFGMAGEGTNLPWQNTVLLAIQRADVRQPVGRIRREYEGKDVTVPTVIDILDLDSPVFTGYARKRAEWYKSIGADVVAIEEEQGGSHGN